jgi:hypothetical protein
VAGVLGAPGDIESLVRMLPYLDEKTILPTSEDIEKKLPFRSDTPVSRAATGLGTLGGGFYYGPGSPLRVVGALPRAIKHGAEEFAKASVAGAPHVIKPKGGNWLSGSVESSLKPLRRDLITGTTPEKALAQMRVQYTPEALAKMPEALQQNIVRNFADLEQRVALNKWVDSNLTNYVKKEMGTPEDPVRNLIDQGISHLPQDALQRGEWLSENMENIRRSEGFPGAGMAKTDAGRGWENLADESIQITAPRVANEEMLKANPWLSKLDPDQSVYRSRARDTEELGFDHIMDVLRQDVESGRIRPEQLNKVSMEQAVRRTFEYDQEMAKKMRETALKQQEGFPLYKEYPEGYKWIELAKPEPAKALPEGWSEPVAKGNALQTRSPNGDIVLGFDLPDLVKNIYKRHPETPGNPYTALEDALKYEGDTMGHCVGGYCPDVLAGNTRIFSLRDAKGEPHVTVETRPSEITPFDLPKDIYDEYRRHAAIGIPAHGGRPGATEWVKHFYPDVAEKIIPPDRIIQIKGKQNAKPKEDYIPFVQDFVRGGKWSDVGDFKNTGLIREGDQIMTPAEHADWLLKQLGNPPAEGMKRGGNVSISSNPDTMMLELNNQKMAGGGIAKLLRAAPKSKAEIEAIAERIAPQMLGEFVRGEKGTQSVAGKTQKQFAKEKEMKHDIRPTKGESKIPKPVSIEELKDQVMIGIPGDPTISNKTVYSINGMPLDSPSPQHGGPLYGLEHEGDAFWASGLGAANRVQGIAREASQQYDMPVLGKYVMMGPDSINYAQHFADANLAAINLDKMNKAQVEAFNKLVREGYPYKKKGEDFTRQRVFPAFPGIENPSEAYLHFSIDPELRKHFNALMQMPTVTEKYNLPSGIDVRHAVTEPDLRDLEIGVTGKSIGRMRPEVTKLGLSEHPTYSHDIPGEFMGSSKYPIPYELSFPDTVKSVRENPKQAPQEFGSFKMVGPRQVIDQQLIDEIRQYEETIKKLTGKKAGGEVKKPAAYIDGNEFVLAAQKYGIKDSMNNLNKIVDLVNKGLSVDDAARQVADSGMNKAAGGSVAKMAALAKLAKMREEMTPRAEAVKSLIAKDENKYLRDVAPNSLTNEEIEAEVKRMAARAEASQPEVKKADGGAINYNTAPDMSDGGRIMQGAPFKRGGKVKMTPNRDTMFMELSNKKLKRK